jgi:hypothetical protein
MNCKIFGPYFVGAALLVIVLCACSGSPTGPKRIQADGVTYIACGGAVWIPAAKDTAGDDSAGTYDVVFTDPQGNKRELKRVRSLWVTNLPDDSPECKPH